MEKNNTMDDNVADEKPRSITENSLHEKHKLTENTTGDEKLSPDQDEVPKKKKKKRDLPPTITYDLDLLFSNNGKRSGGSHLTCQDIRMLYMLKVHGERFPCHPTWCRVQHVEKIKHTIVLIVGCVSEDDFKNNKECFPFLNENFNQALPLRLEGTDTLVKPPLESFLRYRMPKKLQEEKKLERDKDMNSNSDDINSYLLSETQLRADNFPEWNSAAMEHGVVSTRRSGKRTLPYKYSNLYAIDCEMCITSLNDHALTRISIVNDELEKVYDKLVKPGEPITDYLTQFSGITAEMMKDVTTTLADVQRDVLNIVKPDDILVGHSLDFDLRSLKLHHDNIIDTSILYADARGPRYKSSLKYLAKTYLSRDIQASESGHCSIEDAKTCMELVLLKLKKGSEFGVPGQENEGIFEALSRAGKRGALIASPVIVKQHSFGNTHSVPCMTDDQIVSNCKRYLKEVDFTFSHMKRYENLIKDPNQYHSEITEDERQTCFRSIDDDIAEILKDIPSNILVIVTLSSGYFSPEILKLIKNKETRKSIEVKKAVRKARHAVCFVKVT